MRLPPLGCEPAEAFPVGAKRSGKQRSKRAQSEIFKGPRPLFHENRVRVDGGGEENGWFIGVAHAGNRRAIVCPLIGCCRRRGMDPSAYLKDVPTRLPAAASWTLWELNCRPEQGLRRRRVPLQRWRKRRKTRRRRQRGGLAHRLHRHCKGRWAGRAGCLVVALRVGSFRKNRKKAFCNNSPNRRRLLRR